MQKEILNSILTVRQSSGTGEEKVCIQNIGNSLSLHCQELPHSKVVAVNLDFHKVYSEVIWLMTEQLFAFLKRKSVFINNNSMIRFPC